MQKLILVGLTALLLILTFFTDVFINKTFLTASLASISDYFRIDLNKENEALKLENESLKAQLQKAQIFYTSFENSEEDKALAQKYIPAKIFSTYPFNIKGALTLNKGANQGIKKDSAVLAGEGILLGQISEVYENSSIVRTVYDPKWQLPVKVGEEKINGLFVGGNDPKITLIEKPVKIGDAIFIDSKDFPLFLKLGEIKEMREENGGVFKEVAIVKTPYNISELDTVYVSD